MNKGLKSMIICTFLFIIMMPQLYAMSNDVEEGYYNIVSAIDDKMMVDVSYASSESKANIHLWTSNDTVAQMFKFIRTSDGYYKIVAVCSGKALDVQLAKNEPGTNVWQHDVNDSDAQKWKLTATDNKSEYLYITSKIGNLNLDVSGGIAQDGTNIQVWASNGTAAQKYKLKKINIDKRMCSNSSRDYGTRINWIKEYILDYYMSKNIKNVLVVGNPKFCKNFYKIFKNQDKFKFDTLTSIKGIENFSSYDLIINDKYDSRFTHILFENIKVDNFRYTYPACLYQLTIDYLKKNTIPVYFFNAPSASKIKNMNELECDICSGKCPEDFDLPNYPDFLNKVYSNKKCIEYIQSEDFKKGYQIRKIKNHYALADYCGKYCNNIGGRRITPSAPSKYRNCIYMYGPCTIHGQYVPDDYTIENFVQKDINIDFCNTYKIENCGLYAGGEVNIFEYILDTEFKPGDIVIIEKDFSQELLNVIKKNNCFCKELSPIFDRPNNIGNWMVNSESHINDRGNKAIANYIYSCIKPRVSDSVKREFENKTILFRNRNKLNDDPFIKENPEFIPYLDSIRKISQDKKIQGKKIGSLNVNCNPFTLGHRYLIEEALKRVDHLYLFVVEEDASEFSFKDRYEMVKRGVADLQNITVLKTGKWMCSKFTFPDYFNKDDLQDKIILNPTKDIDIYGKYIAPALGVTIRFFGEEPIDLITRQHNNFMKNNLPKYGIQVCEIPRKTLPDGQVISASKVRKFLKEKKFDEMKRFLPDSTYNYLIAHFS